MLGYYITKANAMQELETIYHGTIYIIANHFINIKQIRVIDLEKYASYGEPIYIFTEDVRVKVGDAPMKILISLVIFETIVFLCSVLFV